MEDFMVIKQKDYFINPNINLNKHKKAQEKSLDVLIIQINVGYIIENMQQCFNNLRLDFARLNKTKVNLII